MNRVGADVSGFEAGSWDLCYDLLSKVSGNLGAQDERPLGTCVNMGERGAKVSVMLLKLQHSVPDGRHCK